MTSDHADEDLMTRRQVAFLFRVTSQAVVRLARRGRLTEVRNCDGKPRYRRAEVEELFRSSFRGENHRAPVRGRPVSRRGGRRSRRWTLPGTWPGTAFSGRVRSSDSSSRTSALPATPTSPDPGLSSCLHLAVPGLLRRSGLAGALARRQAGPPA